jgi:hypothetical protein
MSQTLQRGRVAQTLQLLPDGRKESTHACHRRGIHSRQATRAKVESGVVLLTTGTLIQAILLLPMPGTRDRQLSPRHFIEKIQAAHAEQPRRPSAADPSPRHQRCRRLQQQAAIRPLARFAQQKRHLIRNLQSHLAWAHFTTRPSPRQCRCSGPDMPVFRPSRLRGFFSAAASGLRIPPRAARRRKHGFPISCAANRIFQKICPPLSQNRAKRVNPYDDSHLIQPHPRALHPARFLPRRIARNSSSLFPCLIPQNLFLAAHMLPIFSVARSDADSRTRGLADSRTRAIEDRGSRSASVRTGGERTSSLSGTAGISPWLGQPVPVRCRDILSRHSRWLPRLAAGRASGLPPQSTVAALCKRHASRLFHF